MSESDDQLGEIRVPDINVMVFQRSTELDFLSSHRLDLDD